MPEVIAGYWRGGAAGLRSGIGTAEVYLNGPNGRVPAVGDVFKNPALAKTYRLIGEGGADAYYRGAIADHRAALSAPGLTVTNARNLLLPALNKIIAMPGLYESNRFAAVKLGEETKVLLTMGEKISVARLNRRLLEDAYPAGIVSSGFGGSFFLRSSNCFTKSFVVGSVLLKWSSNCCC